MRRILIVLAGFAVVSIAAESSAGAQSASATLTVSASVAKHCTVTTTPVNFGAYNPVTVNATAPLDNTGTIAVTCTKGATAWVGLNNGTATGTTRQMSSSAERLNYELYTDSTHSTVWGNTVTTGVNVPASTGPQTPQNLTVYGRVAAGQNAAVGDYTDTVTATVNF